MGLTLVPFSAVNQCLVVEIMLLNVPLLLFITIFCVMGGQLFDCQVLNSHTAALGAIEIARDRYLEALSRWKKVIIDKKCWYQQSLEL
ncbi:leucyl/phenylalanyl-tRNA--protein transferase [Proteus mirabilis]|uniref:Leucyl/phenylalanyl-tRNA--protein transferase n=1 Tax=Proteus mirabilis TaxID=584 RepID=A0A379FGK8_PROMI|nr:leucyl/phenylalanyl-tRNA--protein transferase [Proteus mirabilis]